MMRDVGNECPGGPKQPFNWQHPVLAAADLPDLELSKMLQRLVVNESLVRVLARGSEGSGAIHLMSSGLVKLFAPTGHPPDISPMLQQGHRGNHGDSRVLELLVWGGWHCASCSGHSAGAERRKRRSTTSCASRSGAAGTLAGEGTESKGVHSRQDDNAARNQDGHGRSPRHVSLQHLAEVVSTRGSVVRCSFARIAGTKYQHESLLAVSVSVPAITLTFPGPASSDSNYPRATASFQNVLSHSWWWGSWSVTFQTFFLARSQSAATHVSVQLTSDNPFQT